MKLISRDRAIIVTLQGGLGNQLFQWAYGRALQADGRVVFFDRVRCRGNRPYALGALVPESARVSRLTGWVLLALERCGLLNESSRIRDVRQRRSGYDESLNARLDRASYLRGSFQAPQYFSDVQDTVRSEAMVHLTTMLTSDGVSLSAELQQDPRSVAVHVRRGDYVSNPNAAAMHGVLGRAYYDAALDDMASRGFTRRVWFSDDLEWVRDNFAQPGDVVCSPSSTSGDGGEIALMASCRAQIIANSSFSWWGAWLSGEVSGSNVIAPRSWFADGHSDAADLIPAGWKQI